MQLMQATSSCVVWSPLVTTSERSLGTILFTHERFRRKRLSDAHSAASRVCGGVCRCSLSRVPPAPPAAQTPTTCRRMDSGASPPSTTIFYRCVTLPRSMTTTINNHRYSAAPDDVGRSTFLLFDSNFSRMKSQALVVRLNMAFKFRLIA